MSILPAYILLIYSIFIRITYLRIPFHIIVILYLLVSFSNSPNISSYPEAICARIIY
jgi:hypothetical protein